METVVTATAAIVTVAAATAVLETVEVGTVIVADLTEEVVTAADVNWSVAWQTETSYLWKLVFSGRMLKLVVIKEYIFLR